MSTLHTVILVLSLTDDFNEADIYRTQESIVATRFA